VPVLEARGQPWREGFADWLPLSQVDAFCDLLAEQLLQQIADSMGFASTTRWTQWARELTELARLDDPLHTYALCDTCTLAF
jgi:hypothetical protein